MLCMVENFKVKIGLDPPPDPKIKAGVFLFICALSAACKPPVCVHSSSTDFEGCPCCILSRNGRKFGQIARLLLSL
jgi:hypothetical protein